MRFFEVVLSGAALVSAAFAVEFNSWPKAVKAGDVVELAYSPKDNTPTTIILRKGPSTNLNTLATITTSAVGGSFKWTVPKDLVDGADYAFEIRQAGQAPNYSGQFGLTGGSGVVSSSASSSASGSASASASGSASSSASASASTASSVSSSASGSASGSASSSIRPTTGLNSTASIPSASSTTGSAPVSSRTSSTQPPENSGSASSLGMNAAAVLGAFGAFAYLF